MYFLLETVEILRYQQYSTTGTGERKLKKPQTNTGSSLVGKHDPPSYKAMDIIIAVIDLDVVSQAAWIILKVEVQKAQVNALTVLESNVPVADLVVIILIWEAWRFENSLWVCKDTTTLLGCNRKRMFT